MPPYANTPPEPDELEALSEDVVYEFVMLHNTSVWCVEARMQSARATSDLGRIELSMRGDAYLESFLIHARNLHSFFAGNVTRDDDGNRKGDDLFALDYLPDWRGNGRELQRLQSSIRTINKRVQHVTAYRHRVPKTDDSQGIGDIVNAAESVWDDFVSRLDGRSVWFNVPRA
jgi:hypothetical protein